MPTPNELAELEAWEQSQLVEVKAELEGTEAPFSPALSRFRLHAWVSKSKGRNRSPRRRLKEVELVRDLQNTDQPPHWTSTSKLPYDTLATETYGDDTHMDGLELEARLMREIGDCPP